MVGAISGFCGGGIKGYAKYKSFGVEKVGRLKASNHRSKKGALGIKYHFNRVKSHNRRVVHSIELHRPHKGGNPHNKWHWQLNRWHNNKSHPLKYRKIWGGKWDDTKH